MLKREVIVPSNLSQLQLKRLIEPWAMQQGAEVKPMGRLTRPYETEGESMHWHISGRRKGMGTIEVTYIPSSGSLTVLVHDNTRGVWAGARYQKLVWGD